MPKIPLKNTFWGVFWPTSTFEGIYRFYFQKWNLKVPSKVDSGKKNEEKNAYFGFFAPKSPLKNPKYAFLGVFFGRNQLLRALLDNELSKVES